MIAKHRSPGETIFTQVLSLGDRNGRRNFDGLFEVHHPPAPQNRETCGAARVGSFKGVDNPGWVIRNSVAGSAPRTRGVLGILIEFTASCRARVV